MKIFKYLYNTLDEEKSGYIFAKDKTNAIDKLTKKHVDFINITELSLLNIINPNAKLDELENIFWQLGFGINSSLGLITLLESIRAGLHFREHIKLLDSIIHTLNGGESISVGLKKHKKTCGNLVVVLFEIGEKSGKMSEMCEICAKEIRSKNEFMQSLVKAMIYPCLLLLSCVVAFFILSIYVVPEFANIYGELNASLPASTRYILGISGFLNEYFIQIVIFFIAFIALLVALFSKKVIKDRILLNLPVINRILLDYELYRYFLGLYYFLSSKVGFLESIKICNSLIDNVIIKDSFKPMVDYLNGGHSLSYGFYHIDIEIANIPLLQSGEESGAFDKTLQLNYEFYKKRYKKALENISIIIEPLITILMGFFITFLAFSVVSPMWQLLEIAV